MATQLRIESGRGCKSLCSPATHDKLCLPTLVYVAHVPGGTFYLLFFVKVCAGAVICNAPCARSQLSCSKAPNRVIKGVIYTPISRPRRRQGGSLSTIREERRTILRDAHLIAAKGQRVQGEAVTHYSLQVFRIYFLPRLLLC